MYMTRKISLPAFNDSQHIGLCIYSVAITSTIVTPVVQFIADKHTVVIALSSFVIWLCTTASLIILFVPKIMMV